MVPVQAAVRPDPQGVAGVLEQDLDRPAFSVREVVVDGVPSVKAVQADGRPYPDQAEVVLDDGADRIG